MRLAVLSACYFAVMLFAGALDRITAQPSTPISASDTAQTIVSGVPVTPSYWTMIGAMITDTRFTTLIMGLSAGPGRVLEGIADRIADDARLVALRALARVLGWSSLGSSSISFLALSQAPPELFRNTASSCPEMMMPASKPPRASIPSSRPITTGVTMPSSASPTSSFCAAAVEIFDRLPVIRLDAALEHARLELPAHFEHDQRGRAADRLDGKRREQPGDRAADQHADEHLRHVDADAVARSAAQGAMPSEV